jgi:uncharacterized protein
MALVARLIVQLLAFYLLVVILVYFYQRNLQYFPDRAAVGAPKDSGVPEMKLVSVRTSDNLTLAAWFAPPKDKGGKIVVMFHGNAGNIAGRSVKARYFMDRGYGVYLCEYRGFGGNPGSPSEQGLYLDARAGLKWLEEQGYTPGQFVIYGESIGTGVAVQMALEVQPRLVILEAPFSSAADVAKMRYSFLPVDLMLKDRYDSIDKIGKINASLLIVHGDEDPVIPLRFGKKLFEAANHPKEFCTIEAAGHNDLYDHHAGHIICDWLDKQVKDERKG